MTQTQKIHRIIYGPSYFEIIVVHACGAVLGLMLALAVCSMIEKTLFPIVTEFKMTQLQPTERGAIISGSLYKRRSCKLIATNVYGHNAKKEKTLLYTFTDTHELAQMGTGLQSWGPIAVHLDAALNAAESISVQATHECHPLWQQETFYGKFDARMIQ
jgi:hypothetical protein